MKFRHFDNTKTLNCKIRCYEDISQSDYLLMSNNRRMQTVFYKQRLKKKPSSSIIRQAKKEEYGFYHHLRKGHRYTWVSEWSFILIKILFDIFGDDNIVYLHYVALVGRERGLCSNGLGGGLALPHLKSPFLEQNAVSIIRLEAGLNYEFDSLQGTPVNTAIFLLASDKRPGDIFRMQAACADIFKTYTFNSSSYDDVDLLAVFRDHL